MLEQYVPQVGLAKTSLEYQQALLRFIAAINDTHANLWSSIASRPPIGPCQIPVDIRFVEGKPYVLRKISRTPLEAGLEPGDVIEELDGKPVQEILDSWLPLYAASNLAAKLRDIGNYLTRGACGDVSVAVKRAGAEESQFLIATRVPSNTLDFGATYTHDRPGPVFQKLADDIAYLKLSSVRAADSAAYVRSAAGTQGLIIDIRNYPSEFVVFTLGNLLVSNPVEFVRFTNSNITNPGAFQWGAVTSLSPAVPHYAGKVVILIDEVTQSQAEYTTMAFRNAPGALVIGSTTAGADGNVSTIPLPGGLSSYISGIGVYYPDFRPTQRIGIIPDIEVKPTIEGLREGRDELIEEAIRRIRGGSQ